MVITHIVESMWFRRRVILQKIPRDSRVLDVGRHFGLMGSTDEKRECNDDCEDQEEGTAIEIDMMSLRGLFSTSKRGVNWGICAYIRHVVLKRPFLLILRDGMSSSCSESNGIL